MLAMLVTDAVLKSGTDTNNEQLANIVVMLLTDAVLKRGTDTKEEQPLNMLAALIIFPIMPNDTFDNLAKLVNKGLNEVTPPILTPEKLINSLQ
jgi:hypothetical protein